ncbi:unnamed protein product [Oncorhynchus mykiss]|uniref:Uncharacterized protein n=1 Tax=Oncorhynchus mykiss TaxID=8022 RepID=A0A060Z0N2_ONCMY|nr:unnamed protein product [Oncorhynchus mykiss]
MESRYILNHLENVKIPSNYTILLLYVSSSLNPPPPNASSVSRWEILQQDKGELERRFERELEGLRAQQQSELGRLEERLRQYHSLEIQRLEAQRQEQLERLRTQQLEQMEEVTENHEEALTEMENNHNDTLVTLKEEHARTVKSTFIKY